MSLIHVLAYAEWQAGFVLATIQQGLSGADASMALCIMPVMVQNLPSTYMHCISLVCFAYAWGRIAVLFTLCRAWPSVMALLHLHLVPVG